MALLGHILKGARTIRMTSSSDSSRLSQAMYEALLEHAKATKKCSEVCAAKAFGPTVAERNRKLHLQYLDVLNLRNESRNFLTNWFQWTVRY